MSGLKKKKTTKKTWWPTNKVALGVCYWLLCTDLGDRILCTSTPNHNIHGENGVYQWWTVCALKSKSVPEIPFPVIWRPKFQKIPLSVLLTQLKVKKLNLWEKRAVEKSAWIKACIGHLINRIAFFKHLLITSN